MKKKLEKYKQIHKLKWQERDKEWRKKFGQKVSEGLVNSKKFQNIKLHKNHKSCFVYFYDEIMFCRSSWEEIIANFLYKNSLRFNIEPFAIKYYDRECYKERRTKIDFCVEINNKKILFEVKPKVFINDCQYKIEGIVDFCLENNYEFYILTEHYLNEKIFNMLILNIKNDLYNGEWFKILNRTFDDAIKIK